MRRNKHLYHIYLKHEFRDDVRHSWNSTITKLHECKTKAEVDKYLFYHSYMETKIDPNDDGSHWLDIKTLFYVRIR